MKALKEILQLILIIIVIVLTVSESRNVVQKKSIDPDTYRNFSQIVESKGYPIEVHFAVTEDGYILRLFRIPYGINGTNNNPRPPVLLQHGLLDSAFTWIFNEPNESLSYVLADKGFDVWMGNNRGNVYSTNSTTLNPNDTAFWKFSWDEMAKYDFPAQIKYILSITEYSTLSYVGHSQGTIQAFAGLIVAPEIASMLNIFIGLGPVTRVKNITSLVMVDLADLYIDDLFILFGLNDFAPAITNIILKTLFVDFCYDCSICCDDIIEAICGPHQGSFNDSRMAVMASHEPGGTSVQNMAHWGQNVRSGFFQMYDWGISGNLIHYNQTTPPLYNLAKLPSSIPYVMYSGAKDELADPIDVEWLLPQIPNLVYHQELSSYAHLDFVWDYDAVIDIYDASLINFLEKASKMI